MQNADMQDLVSDLIDEFDILLGEHESVFEWLKENPDNLITFEFTADSTKIWINGKPFDYPEERI